MRKTRFLAIVLVVAVMLMGAGYAAWTQNIQLNSTVSTGNLTIEIEDIGNKYEVKDLENTFGDNFAGANYGRFEQNSNYTLNAITPQVSDDGNTITYEIGELLPGSSAYTALRFNNAGTVPATVDTLTFSAQLVGDTNADIFNYLKAKAVYVDSQENFAYHTNYFNVGNGDFQQGLQEFVGKVVMPGDDDNYCNFFIHFMLVDDAPNDTTENADITCQLNLSFIQSNLYEAD